MLHVENIVDEIVVLLFGLGSAVIDNVPLVAASMGMFSEPLDNPLWHFIAYSAARVIREIEKRARKYLNSSFIFTDI